MLQPQWRGSFLFLWLANPSFFRLKWLYSHQKVWEALVCLFLKLCRANHLHLITPEGWVLSGSPGSCQGLSLPWIHPFVQLLLLSQFSATPPTLIPSCLILWASFALRMLLQTHKHTRIGTFLVPERMFPFFFSWPIYEEWEHKERIKTGRSLTLEINFNRTLATFLQMSPPITEIQIIIYSQSFSEARIMCQALEFNSHFQYVWKLSTFPLPQANIS